MLRKRPVAGDIAAMPDGTIVAIESVGMRWVRVRSAEKAFQVNIRHLHEPPPSAVSPAPAAGKNPAAGSRPSMSELDAEFLSELAPED